MNQRSFSANQNLFREANDRNSKIIKCLAKASTLAKDIKKIEKHDGSFTEDSDEILNEFKCFYENLCQPKRKSNQLCMKSQEKSIEKIFTQKKKSIEKIRNEFDEILDDPLNVITELEIEKAILKLNSNSAP